VRQITSDNNCSVEFNPAGCFVKDLQTSRNVIVQCNSSGPLYPLRFPAATFIAGSTSSFWHRRLGHPGHEALSKLALVLPFCTKEVSSDLCHACQLGCHTRLPFYASLSRATSIFDIIHCDLWTSPVLSLSGFKYYLVILDDFSHYLWTFPLRLKSDTFPTLTNFFSDVAT
jgi:hypothetical protein